MLDVHIFEKLLQIFILFELTLALKCATMLGYFYIYVY